MALDLADRLLTIVVTATLTSAAWIVVGSTYVARVGEPRPSRSAEPEPAAARRYAPCDDNLCSLRF